MRRFPISWLVAMLAVLCGCPEEGYVYAPSVQCIVFQDQDEAWIAQVITKHQSDGGYWDEFTATVSGVSLALTNDAVERYDGMWNEYRATLPDALSPGDEVVFALDHPGLGAVDVSLTVCGTVPEYETDPPFEEWVARAVDGDPNNDTLTVTTPALEHATDLSASLGLYEVVDGLFGPMTTMVDNGHVDAYVQDERSIVLPTDADDDAWSSFWEALSGKWEQCADLSLRLYVHWQWDDYFNWGEDIDIEVKHATVGLAEDIPLYSAGGGYGAYNCSCVCDCDTCEGTTDGVEYGTDLTCDDVCPGTCDFAGELCGAYTGSSTGSCEGPLEPPADTPDCGNSLPPSTGTGAACDHGQPGGGGAARASATAPLAVLALLLLASRIRRQRRADS